MTGIGKLSQRPTLVVADPLGAAQIGSGALFSLRLLSVLPTNSGPVQIVAPVVVQATD